MDDGLPPPLDPALRPAPRRNSSRIVAVAVLIFGVVVFLCVCTLVGLRVGGLIGVYKVLNAAMAPAIESGDNIMTEGVTYRFRPPRRGEIVLIKADGLPYAKPGERYVKRLVGLPGDRLRITGGTLYINDQPAPFRNKEGEIRYTTGLGSHLRREDETFAVPDGCCFVLGDNSPGSVDSRIWGALPVDRVIGRAMLCYLPAGNAGWLR